MEITTASDGYRIRFDLGRQGTRGKRMGGGYNHKYLLIYVVCTKHKNGR